MEYRTLDVTVLSAEDLKAPRFGKLQPYAVVWLDRHDRRTTRVDKDGRHNPSWNERLSFAVPEHLLRHPGSSLHVEIYSKGSVMGSKLLGTAVMPLPDLVQQAETNEVCMYQLRKRSAKARGAVRVSVHVGEKMEAPAAAGYGRAGYGSGSEPVTAYPYNNQKMGYGGYAQGYPPQQQYQPYPAQGYYPPQQQGYYPQQQQGYGRRPGRFGGMGGMGTGLAAGALGGLLVGDLLGDFGGGGYGDGGYGGGGYDGGGYDGGNFDNGGGFDGGDFDGGGGGFDGGGFGGF